MNKKFVAYLRVSTNRQGESGLGLEAQRAAVVNYVQSLKGGAEIVKEFVEIESGKNADRPVLAEARHKRTRLQTKATQQLCKSGYTAKHYRKLSVRAAIACAQGRAANRARSAG